MSSLTGLRSPDSDRYTVVEKDEFSSHLPWFNFIATTAQWGYSVANWYAVPAMPFPAGKISWEYPMRGQFSIFQAAGGGIESKSQKFDPAAR
jgi:hypothetical protein